MVETKDNLEVEHVEATAITANALEQMERANIDIQIATAHKYPKHKTKQLSAIKADMLSFATLDEDTAAACFYTLPRGNKVIQGPSIRMAEIAVSCYGNIRNCVRTIEVVGCGPTPHVVVQAVCHDLERNVAVSIEKRRRITKKKKNKNVDEDDITLAVNAGASIAFRDAAFKVIPQALIKPVWEAAKKVAIGDIRSIVETRGKCIERLNKMGVTVDRILSVLECRAVEDIGQPQLEVLFGLGTAIKDGDCTLEEAFPLDFEGAQKEATEKVKAEQGSEEISEAKTQTTDEPAASAEEAAARKAKAEKQKEDLAVSGETTKRKKSVKKTAEKDKDKKPKYHCPNCKPPRNFDEKGNEVAGNMKGGSLQCPKCLNWNVSLTDQPDFLNDEPVDPDIHEDNN